MHPLRWAAIALFVLGVALLAVAIATGQATVYLVLVFPMVQATGGIAFAAIAAVFGAFLLLFASFALAPPGLTAAESPSTSPPPTESPAETPRRQTRAGGVIFLGPLPIVFGSDRQVARWMIVAAFVLFVLLLVFWIVVAVL